MLLVMQGIMQSPTNNPFRSKLIKLSAEGGGVMFVHPCCVCGNKDAPFGISAAPPRGKKSDNYPICNWKGINWHCSECLPKDPPAPLQNKLL